MMRWLAWGLAALLLAAAVAVWLFPLSLALRLAEAPIEGRPTGTVWNGKIEDAVVQGTPLGVVEVQGRFFPTVTGRPSAAIFVDGPTGTGRADASLSGGSVTLRGIDASVPVAPLGLDGPFGGTLGGRVDVSGDAVFAPAGCRDAALSVSTDILDDSLRRFGQDGVRLDGPATCEDGVLVAALAGDGAMGGAALTMRLRPGVYTSELTVSPNDERAGALLTRYGFRRTGDGYTVIDRGTW